METLTLNSGTSPEPFRTGTASNPNATVGGPFIIAGGIIVVIGLLTSNLLIILLGLFTATFLSVTGVFRDA